MGQASEFRTQEPVIISLDDDRLSGHPRRTAKVEFFKL
jgi:hypothetical protein